MEYVKCDDVYQSADDSKSTHEFNFNKYMTTKSSVCKAKKLEVQTDCLTNGSKSRSQRHRIYHSNMAIATCQSIGDISHQMEERKYIPNPLFHTVQAQNIKPKKIGYWGPLLRYGTYGIYKKFSDNVILKKKRSPENGKVTDEHLLKEQLRQLIDIPLDIKIPRQAMICTIQTHSRCTISDLRKLERDRILHTTINYSSALEQLTNKCGTCPKYLYTTVSNIPEIERQYFTMSDGDDIRKTYLSNDCSRLLEIKPICDYFACDLFISDIIISQGFALWKRRARETCARKAFKVLEQPCYVVGSTRYWYHADFCTACLTDDLQTVTMLPPFLTDPTEPLFKKDVNINKSNPEENFDILNPKSIDDFWLYAPTLLEKGRIKDIDPQILLYQSAEFSQMNISFEIETCFDESYTCMVLIDKSPAMTVEGLGSLEQARQAASLVLVDKLLDTQPIVVLKEPYHAQYNKIQREHLFHENDFIVRSLLWSPTDVSPPVSFEVLSDIIDSESFHSSDQQTTPSSTEIISDIEVLTYFINLYAQSSIVSPLQLRPEHISHDLWPLITEVSRLSGLLVLTMNRCTVEPGSVLICKQVPHKQLKAILYEKKEFGVFQLLCQGDLPQGYLSDLRGYMCGGDSDGMEELDEGGEGLAVVNDGCTDITRTLSRGPEHTMSDYHVINDIPRELIPGLDF